MVNEKNSRTKMKGKKRKDRSSDDEGERLVQYNPTKSSRKEEEEPVPEKPNLHNEESSPWRNLQLILSLQNKNLDLHTKLELTYNYVKSRTADEANESTEVSETVSLARLVVFVGNWIQTVLIASVKKDKTVELKNQQKDAAACLDNRCWIILKFCLEESMKFNVSLCILRDFLIVIEYIAMHVLSHLTKEPFDLESSFFSCNEQDFPKNVLDCVSLVFTSHGGVSNENLDLWTTTICTVLKLLQKVVADKIDESGTGSFVINLSSYLLEPFADFLRVHPIRKNSFNDFIDRLLEPLLHLLEALDDRTCSASSGWSKNLLESVKDVLVQGLFHQTHLDGYMCLQSADKYKTSDGEKLKVDARLLKSYHRHLFDKLDKIIANKNLLPLGGIGPLFQLFVSCVSKHKVGSYIRDGSKHPDGSSTNHMPDNASYKSKSVVEENHHNLTSLDTEKRKSLFDFFIQIMEYFLHQVNIISQAGLEVGLNWLDLLGILKSSNKLLEAFKQEGIYTKKKNTSQEGIDTKTKNTSQEGINTKTKNTSEGAGVNFLLFIYESVMSTAFLVVDDLLLSPSMSNKLQEVHILLMKELVLAVHCLLDIEYEVVANDLGRLWKLVLSFSSCGHSLVEASNQHLLYSQILHLACRLIELYNEVRQVNVPIFALCEAVRLLVSPVSECQNPILESYSSCVKSLSMLLCAPEFRHSICSAINSIPEGQTSGCIQQVATDISDSLEWLKVQYQLAYGEGISRTGHDNSGFQYELQAEVLGRYLTEVYTLILDSITVTTGNSCLVSISVNSLMSIFCSSSSAIDSFQSDGNSKLFSFIFGKISCDAPAESHPVPHWILFFFFRLFLSCRSLRNQVITLVPPNISKKMSKTFNDSFAAISGNDWLENGNQYMDDSFSCIVKGSGSVLTLVETVHNVYLHNSSTLCPPLFYVLCVIALQRLADLNRKLKSFEYILARSEPFEKITDDSSKPSYQNKSKKVMQRILNMKEETAGLTKFILSFVEDMQSILLSTTGSQEDVSFQALHEDREWDYSVGVLNEMSLPSAVWLIVCQNADLWCVHASKKAIKKFLSLLIQLSIPGVKCATKEPESITRKLGPRKTATLHLTSRELLYNTVLYEERFACRHLASTICKLLVTSVLSVFPTLGDVHLKSVPNWAEIIDVLETLSNCASKDKHAENLNQMRLKFSSRSLSRLVGGPCRREQLAPARCIERSSSQKFLNFITWMPKGCLSSKSLLLMANCILNIERVVVGSLLSGLGVLPSEDQFELLRLLLSCRRTLKSLFMTSVEEKTDDRHFSRLYLLFEGSSSVLWLFKSLAAVSEYQRLFSEDIASQVGGMLHSLMDHTSSTLFTITKCLTERVLESYEKDCAGNSSNLNDSHSEFPSSIDLAACLLVVGEKLRDDIQNSFVPFNLSCGNEKGVLSDFQKLKKMSPVISCIQAFLWGIASGLQTINTSSHTRKKGLSKCKVEPLSKLSICVDACTEIIRYFQDFLLLQDDPSHQCLSNTQVMSIDGLDEVKLPNAGSLEDVLASNDASGEPNTNSHAETKKIRFKRSNVESILADDQLFGQSGSVGPLLQRLSEDKNNDVAYFLRYLFFASSAWLRLKSDNSCTPLLKNLVPILNSIPQYVSLEVAYKGDTTTPFHYVWLDGLVKFLEELGNSLPLSNPLSSNSSFTNLIDLHLRFIAACIAIQGKRAVPAFPVSDQLDFKPSDRLDFFESTVAQNASCLVVLKNRLKSSFRALIQKSSELHLSSAIQVIERAVCGLQEGCMDEIFSENSDGGKISATVAAGVECLDLVLEFVTGQKRLSMVESHLRSIISSLLSTIESLQRPDIFIENENTGEKCLVLDSASIVLTCVEVLTRVFGKLSLFQMDSSHIAQCLHIPTVIFENMLQLKCSDNSNLMTVSESRNTHIKSIYISNQRHSLEVYAACCRLLCTVIKHRASDALRCAALLEDSVNVLLYCLETIDIDQGVKYASCLRRVYEELRLQNDEFGRYCHQFLSSYICVYNGFGLSKSMLKSKIDEAMRPGVYALIDACSEHDLQHLHTVFGEGPCRKTLGDLIEAYKLNFQYEGKV